MNRCESVYCTTPGTTLVAYDVTPNEPYASYRYAFHCGTYDHQRDVNIAQTADGSVWVYEDTDI